MSASSSTTTTERAEAAKALRSRNLRLAFILASIAACFLAGFVIKMTVLGY